MGSVNKELLQVSKVLQEKKKALPAKMLKSIWKKKAIQ